MLAKVKNDHANLNHFFNEFTVRKKIKGTFMKFYEKKCSVRKRWQNYLIWRYRNEQKCRCRNQSGTRIRGPSLSPVLDWDTKSNRSKQMVLIWFAYYVNESKTFWFGLLVIATKAKYFDLFCLWSELKQNVLIWSAYYRNKSKTFWFGLVITGTKKQNIWFGLLIIGTKAKLFDLLLKLS